MFPAGDGPDDDESAVGVPNGGTLKPLKWRSRHLEAFKMLLVGGFKHFLFSMSYGDNP